MNWFYIVHELINEALHSLFLVNYIWEMCGIFMYYSWDFICHARKNSVLFYDILLWATCSQKHQTGFSLKGKLVQIEDRSDRLISHVFLISVPTLVQKQSAAAEYNQLHSLENKLMPPMSCWILYHIWIYPVSLFDWLV